MRTVEPTPRGVTKTRFRQSPDKAATRSVSDFQKSGERL
jgi:hypothetical protein